MKKKLFSIMLAAIIMLSMVGCNSSKPEKTVNTVLKSAQKFDIESIRNLIDPELRDDYILEEDIESNEEMSYFIDFFKKNASKIKYTIGETVVDDDFACVNVEFEYVDGLDALEYALTQLLTKSFGSLFTETEMDAEEIKKIVSNALNEYQSENGEYFLMDEISFDCVKIDNKWYLDGIDDDFLNVLFCNYID